MKRKIFIKASVITIALMLLGITSMTAVATCEPQVETLWAGKTIDVGTVTVWNDEYNLYVQYDTTGDW